MNQDLSDLMGGFPGGSVVRNLPDNAGAAKDSGLIPWRRKWQPTPVFLPGKSHRERGDWRATVRGVAEESDGT